MTDFSFVPLSVAIFFATVHYFSPKIFRFQKKLQPHLASLAGGFAIGYVCLELLPEINDYHHVLGKRIYFIIFMGFCVFYGLETLCTKHLPDRLRIKVAFQVRIFINFLYNLVIVFTLGHDLPSNIILTIIFAFCFGLHFLSTDLNLQGRFGQKFISQGRYILMGGVLCGFLLDLLRNPREIVIDIILGALVGFFFYSIFREELPETKKANFPLFLGGGIIFLILHVLLEGGA